MPSRRLPNTTPSVIHVLKTARDEWKNTPNAADRAITAEHWAQIMDTGTPSLLNKLLAATAGVDSALAAQTKATNLLEKSADRTAMLVSHFHQVLDLAIVRGEHPPSVRAYYSRDVSARNIPDLNSHEAIATAADHVVNGEVARENAEGAQFVPMAMPSADQVEVAQAEFDTLAAQSKSAQENTDKAREAVQALYPAAEALATDICDTVEFFYRKDPDASSRRVKCQRWGVVYSYDQPVAPTPAPTPTPTP